MQSRRSTLGLLRDAVLLSSVASAASPLMAAKRGKRPAALLVPLSGDRSALGISIRNAAMLAETDAAALSVLDTGGTPAGAANAARAAVKRGAGLVLGPLSAAETRAVAAAVGAQVPVVALTNDAAARGGGAFVFGITPAQATAAILGYARSRGVRRVVAVDDGTPWSQASVAAARAAEGDLGMTIVPVTGATLPPGVEGDAAFVPGSAVALAPVLKTRGMQLLATMQALDYRPEALAALEGAWIASPDPTKFATFATAYAARNGGRPGAIAALGNDAALIARTLREADQMTREGVLREAGFDGVTGPVRFRSDGSCARDFAILVPTNGVYDKVAESRGA
ncbi:penicillin-binding protein activator [Sphingomonas sp. 2R-10]|uniref:ABC transporter substrate-binding protein n=1 Tax=Sphingomonas sp. 2R-10 TaxID=3045148 RepID=UPI000F78F7E7|nr:penicillin-binding protein activator [Sphingomonas sp. 2R-10]MDJ0278455.1 penicillin-binding protein activator [Sphingomonas sp. 2R-10]